VSSISQTGNPLDQAVLRSQQWCLHRLSVTAPCKTRRLRSWRGFVVVSALLFCVGPLQGQQQDADQAWSKGDYPAARAAYERILSSDPHSARANFRIGILLSWQGKLDSSLVYLGRARASVPADRDIRLAQAQVLAWSKRYADALRQYDSVLVLEPGSHEALLGRARTFAWAGRLADAKAVYQGMLAKDSRDRDAQLGAAQVDAWQGALETAEQGYRAVLADSSQDVDARVGLGYVYLWQGREGAAARQAQYALAIDSTHKGAGELQRILRGDTQPSVETSANWSNDSDHNTSFWQSMVGSARVTPGAGIFGSVNALETSDRVRQGTRVGGELGVSLATGPLRLSGAAGARRLDAEFAGVRTAATYRVQARFRPASSLGVGLGYSRVTFDEIAALIERELDMELLEGGFDARPLKGLTIYGGGDELWLNDGNNRWSVSVGITQKLFRRFFIGTFGRMLAYERRGIGYFSPDRFALGEGIAGYNLERGYWIGSFSGGVGAQQIGEGGAAQSEWHAEVRLGRRWGGGNKVELFGLITNSAVSSTTGAFRFGSAGMLLRLGL
jgi:tetratricopeptide (TPR) repeat protein